MAGPKKSSGQQSQVEVKKAPAVMAEVGRNAWGADRLQEDKASGVLEQRDIEQHGQTYGGLDGWRYLVIPTGEGGTPPAGVEHLRRTYQGNYAIPVTGPLVTDEDGKFLDTDRGREAAEHKGVYCNGIHLCEIWAQSPKVVAHFKRKRRKRCLKDAEWRQIQKDQNFEITDEEQMKDEYDLYQAREAQMREDKQIIAELKRDGEWVSLKKNRTRLGDNPPPGH